MNYDNIPFKTRRTKGGRKRTHVRKEWKFVILALVLISAITLGTLVRVFIAAPSLPYESVSEFTGITPIITDRFDQPIYEDGAVSNYGIYGNLVGYRDKIHNSLLYRHDKLLSSSKVNPIIGHASLEKEPRVMKTTLLSEESQRELVKLFKGYSGCCFSYNYETGEVYTALSLPSYTPGAEDAAYINRCFQSVYIPGSTMKIVTALLAVDQGIKVDKVTYVCNKTYTLSDGNEIVCTGNHGEIGFSTAIGRSCNCYFAQLIESLNLDKALKTLKELGFSVNGANSEGELIDELTKTVSSTNVTNTASFKNVWGLIGQGHTEVNPIDMARIAAAVVNGGVAAEPYIIESIVNPNKGGREIYSADQDELKLIDKKTAEKTATYWKKGVDSYYYKGQGMSSNIDYAKTGTAQQGNGKEDKLLMGVIESSKTAFFIVIEDAGSNVAPMTIANKLAVLLPSYGASQE